MGGLCRPALNKEGLTILWSSSLRPTRSPSPTGFVVANGDAHEGSSAALSRDPEVMEAFLGKKKLPLPPPKA